MGIRIKMKIINIVPCIDGYGTYSLVRDLHLSFLKKGMDSILISFTGRVPEGIDGIYTLNLRTPYDCSVLKKLPRFLEGMLKTENTPLIVHPHLTPCQIFVPICLKIARVNASLFTTEHSTSNRRSNKFWGNIFDGLLFLPYDRVVCVSKAVRNSLRGRNVVNKGKLLVIENGIEIEKFKFRTREYKKGERIVIVSVGRLEQMKNYDNAIRACLLNKELNFEYRLFGRGKEEKMLKALIEEMGLSEKVKLMGFSSDIVQDLKGADIFLMPSLWEGFGLAVLEAMAIGLPVVSSNVAGLRGLVGEHGKSGFLLDPNDIQGIADSLCGLILDASLRRKMGINAMVRAEKFDIKKTAQKYLEAYDFVLSTS